MRFLFVVTGRNCEDQVIGSLTSIADQKGDHDYAVAVVDDASTDRTGEAVKNFCDGRPGWDYTLNDSRVGAMRNQWDAWHSFDAKLDDVVVWVDADDRLAHADVLNVLAMRYGQTRALLTYGSYKPHPASSTCPPARPYPAEVAEKRAFRQWIREGRGIWHNHLRTISYEVLGQITEEDCKDDRGEWWMTGPDMATYLVALELAGSRSVFLADVLYEYYSAGPEAEWRAVPDTVRKNHQEMLAREPKVPVERLRGSASTNTRESAAARRNERLARSRRR